MTLRGTMQRHARQTLTRLDHFGETVLYRPKGTSGPQDRALRATINRGDSVVPSEMSSHVGRLTAIVFTSRDATDGLPTWNPGDRIVMPIRVGAAAAPCQIVRTVSQDEAGIEVEVQG